MHIGYREGRNCLVRAFQVEVTPLDVGASPVHHTRLSEVSVPRYRHFRAVDGEFSGESQRAVVGFSAGFDAHVLVQNC